MATADPRSASRSGVYLLGVSTAAAGIFDLIWGEFEAAHQPIQAWSDHIPGQQAWAYVTAVWLLLAGVALLWQRTVRPGAAASAAIYFIFALFSVPRLYTAPHVLGFRAGVYIGVLVGVAQQLILVAAAMTVYETATGRHRRGLAAVIRWVFGLSCLDFGLAHFTGIQGVARMVPKWMPFGGDFWAVLTGLAFVLAGVAIVSRIADVLATRLLALMLLVFSGLALLPTVLAAPREHIAWGANAYNLAAVAAAWIFAESLANSRAESQSAAPAGSRRLSSPAGTSPRA